MKTVVLLACLSCLCASAQSPDAIKYASRQVLLVSPEPGSEGVLPMVLTTDGQQQLVFVATSQIGDYMKRGAQPIRLEDILSALGASAEALSKLQAENSRLQAENERLWKVAMKDTSKPAPTTVVVQQAPAAQPDRGALLRSWWQPIQIPQIQPIKPLPSGPAPRAPVNCITQYIGNQAFTNCN